MSELFRFIPSVDRLLQLIADDKQLNGLPRVLVKDLINEFLEHCREEIRSGGLASKSELEPEQLRPRLLDSIKAKSRPRFRRVINATGVVVHTNLGRSLLAEAATEAVHKACRFYSNLEFSLDSGKRGSRYSLVEELLCRLTGAEAGLVVNNNAAAVLLMLDTLAKGLEVIVSRGQLVEIGGSFRIPEVMAKSGAILKEVGATNRTHLFDYEQAITPRTAGLLRVHTSNYRIVGFQKEVPLKELATLGKQYDLPVLEDLGSGNLHRFSEIEGFDEPTVDSVLKGGASVVTFSGDKLLGGPQAGIILGKAKYIQQIQKNPLNRALRIDKMTLAALEATLRLYLDHDRAVREIPTLSAILVEPGTLRARAGRLAARLKEAFAADFEVRTQSDSSRVGGGASPETELKTWLVCLKPRQGLSLEKLRQALLRTEPPLVGRVERDSFCLDPRTLNKGEVPLVLDCFKQALEGESDKVRSEE